MTVAFLVLFIAAIVFSTVCVLRFLEVLREAREESDAIERWWAERASYRTTSSIEDDSPENRGPLPDEFRAPCGEVIRFSNPTDSGPRAA